MYGECGTNNRCTRCYMVLTYKHDTVSDTVRQVRIKPILS